MKTAIGHENLIKTFRRLADESKLSHGYIFFGEPQVGKFSFAHSLANYFETGELALPKGILTELHIVKPDEKGTIGIDAIRGLKRFLSQKPTNSPKRTAIIDNAEALTYEAQHALLKITEEPPETGLIILVLPYPDVLFETIQSRLQRIYFPRLKTEIIADWLHKEHKYPKEKAMRIAKLSLGRPGLAFQLAFDEAVQALYREAYAFLRGRRQKAEAVADLVEHPDKIQPFFTALIAKLAEEPVKNYSALRSLVTRFARMSQFTTNKRLQLEAALWTI